MSSSPNLALPLLAAAQAQKHVTHNEALLAVDALLQCAVLDKDLASPPASPADGARYIVAASATGEWAGKTGRIAAWQDGLWQYYGPRPGFMAFVADESLIYVYGSAGWVPITAALGAIQNLNLLGIGTIADATNPLSAKLNKALWTAKSAAEGGDGDLRYTLGKESAADVLSILLQTGYSGRAEIGLVGDDLLRVRTSADGAIWRDAIVASSPERAVKVYGGGGANGGPAAFQVQASDDGGYVYGQSLVAPNVAAGNRVVSLIGTALSPNNAGYLGFHNLGGAGSASNVLMLGIFGHPDWLRIWPNGTISPGSDNAQSAGAPGARFSVVYAGTGSISTSDAREKRVRGTLSEAELRAWGRVRQSAFQWEASVREKAGGARLHAGWIAQEVQDAFKAEGLDASRYGLWCRDSVRPSVARTRQVLRPKLEAFEERSLEAREENGVAVEREVIREAWRPVLRRIPLVGPDGERRQAEIDGRIVELTSEVPVLEEHEEIVHEEGPPEERLGLRYDQCLAIETAYLRWRLEASESQLSELRGRVEAIELAGEARSPG